MNFINNAVDNEKQKTLKNKIFFSGVGIHNGKAVSMSIEPAAVNNGIKFERTDIKGINTINALIGNLKTSSLCTQISNNNYISVSTIEHLMSALNGLNIDNANIKINSPELPALDGSSHEYIKKIIGVGIKHQNQDRKYLKILKRVEVCEGKRSISVTPANRLSINTSISYPNTIIGISSFLYHHSKENFINELSRARTFALYEDVEKMRAAGLAIGGNINNAIVVDKYNIVNNEGLRFDKEFVKHKTLDSLGDFYLLGMPLIGKVRCFAPGHKLNHKFIKAILNDKENYEIVSCPNSDLNNKYYDLFQTKENSQNITNVA